MNNEEPPMLLLERKSTENSRLESVLRGLNRKVIPLELPPMSFEVFEGEKPGAVIIGSSIPVEQQLGTCRTIRDNPETMRLPVLLISRLESSSDILDGLEAGADGIVDEKYTEEGLPRWLDDMSRDDEDLSSEYCSSPVVSFSDRLFRIYTGSENDCCALTGSITCMVRRMRSLERSKRELSGQVATLRRTIQTQAYQIDQQVEERRNVESQLYHFQRTDAIDRIAGAVAHDFNNMLMVIRGFTDLMSLDAPVDSREQKYLGEIRRAIGRASDLTEQLLIFSRKQSYHREKVDVGEMVREIEGMLDTVTGSSIRLALNLTEHTVLVEVDRQQIEQVVLNLVTNARDAMQETGSCTISTSKHEVIPGSPESAEGVPAGIYARLSVTDTGDGMTREVMEHIFEPFFTTKPQGMGTGLGLSTVFGVIRRSNGYVLCSSRIGEGTEFSIYLPVCQGEISDGR